VSKLQEILITIAVVALVFAASRGIDVYYSRPLIYIEGTFPTYIAEEGWLYVVRYSIDAVPYPMYFTTETRAKRFTAYLYRVGRVINDEPEAKVDKKSAGAVDTNP
jgi:hypothetical protein